MQQKSELPEGWELRTVDQIAGLVSGQHILEKDYNNSSTGLAYFTGPADFGLIYPIVSKWTEKPKTIANKDDILITVKGAGVGKVNILDIESAAISRQLMAIRPINFLPKYLFYLLLSTFHETQSLSTGSTVPGISRQSILNIQIPLPPLLEQHRIISAIEALFARLDATNEKLDKVPEILKRFRQSVLADACSGKLTENWRRENLGTVSVINLPEVGAILRKNSIKDGKKEIQKLNTDGLKKIPEQWIWINFSRLICKVKRGPSKKCNQSEEGIRYITSGNIHDGKLRLDTDNKYLSNFDDIEKCRLKPQDLILNCVNSLDKIGKTCVYPELEDEAIIGFNNYALELETEVISPQFINYFCQTDDFKSQLNLLVKHAVNQVSFAKSELDYITVPLPPLPEQQEIVRRVNALFTFADSIEAKVAAARERTEKLRQSILSKAFSGELVPTEAEIAKKEGRDYETAEVLLERIKTEKGKNETKR